MKQKLISFLATHPRNTYSFRDLVSRLGISGNKKNALKELLSDLTKTGEIVRKNGNRWTIGKKHLRRTGKLQVTQKGFGFLISEGFDDDVFISRNSMKNAIHGDIVEVEITSGGREGRTRGRIRKIVERGTETFVGPAFIKQNKWYQSISPVNPERGVMIIDGKPRLLKSGEVVVTRVTDWGTAVSPIKVKVEKVLGSSKDPAIDFDIIKEKFLYQVEFPESVESELRMYHGKNPFSFLDGRKDLRHLDTITIDPESARDFDDALSISKKNNGFELWVHIADVSHFVQLGSETDREAMKRGTSVYFTEGVVPMLPEILSSDLCSLNPGTDRFAMSVFFRLNQHAIVSHWEVHESIIHSNTRLSYQQAQDILDGKSRHESERQIKWLKELTGKLLKDRMSSGSIDFDIPEPVIVLNDGGIPHEIKPGERLVSHRIVEECMLLANRTIAEGFGKISPFVFRVHDKPDEMDVEQLILLLRSIGINVPSGIDPSKSKGMRDLLLLVEESPYKNLIEGIALRAMTKAKYSGKKSMHFGLAFEYYTHFTSPIRRYPDLLVHRLIKERLREKSDRRLREIIGKGLEISNEMEIKAQKAEREYIKLKQLRWLGTQIDQVFTGIISGVVSFGFFVELKQSLAEGLVHTDTLESDDYIYDEDHYRLNGRRTGTSYQLGQEVRVRVVSVNLDQLRANFSLEQ